MPSSLWPSRPPVSRFRRFPQRRFRRPRRGRIGRRDHLRRLAIGRCGRIPARTAIAAVSIFLDLRLGLEPAEAITARAVLPSRFTENVEWCGNLVVVVKLAEPSGKRDAGPLPGTADAHDECGETSMSVPMASSCEPRERSMIAASGTTCHNLKSAALARSSNDARAHRSRRSLATSMKMHATMPGH